ncbi:hypothetical protein [Legionella maioricensis]|uniref:Uncharacterized protein n=1 Tax=Legionella maioricensis TaxID=2896528 RepID=A0A9X2ICW3_9GAMM|nr:hypothetical protein [Legionella maioricensis]MCL9685865.1 hypothetical protein [Legionella maioricensis]MCL9689282.1 hypothetical protein [Legionella maioricensis]
MMRHSIKIFIGIITLFSVPAFAEKAISITVKTNEKSAFAIGYFVGGEAKGSMGKSYSGKGPKNKKYIFGYRKNFIHGDNVYCGTQILTQDSKITLITDGAKCRIVIN